MKRATKGSLLAVGTAMLSPAHYVGFDGQLQSPTRDLVDFELIGKLNGFQVQTLGQATATKETLLGTIQKTAKLLKEGDFFMLSFSGFGGQVPKFGKTSTGHPFSSIGTWCLYDCQVLQAELLLALSGFQKGVQVLVVADCQPASNCLAYQHQMTVAGNFARRVLPLEVAESVYLANKDFYDSTYLKVQESPEIQAAVVWVQACQANQCAFETEWNGCLTAAIKHTWAGGEYRGSFAAFIEEVANIMPPFQTPKLVSYGSPADDFLKKTPFAC